ncbi:MAG: hypothetical protein GX221_02105 [Candidatus Riflebacteria bacterium]|nr:hypothetical protein [Candidatus Riflebacteria bacterium]
MKINKKELLLAVAITTILSASLAFVLKSLYLRGNSVNTDRMKKTLELYAQYRQDYDTEKLANSLAEINLTPQDFSIIIDKFIYYRTREAARKEAEALLKHFKLGGEVKTHETTFVSGMENQPFRLDAEILTLFEESPELVKKAFEG